MKLVPLFDKGRDESSVSGRFYGGRKPKGSILGPSGEKPTAGRCGVAVPTT